jgi:hypothetical protein
LPKQTFSGSINIFCAISRVGLCLDSCAAILNRWAAWAGLAQADGQSEAAGQQNKLRATVGGRSARSQNIMDVANGIAEAVPSKVRCLFIYKGHN